MPVEIAAGNFFPVPRIWRGEVDPELAAAKHRELLAQALNEAAAAALAHEVLKDTSTTTQNTTGSFVAYAGLTITVVPPVPSFIVIVCQFQWDIDTVGTGHLAARIAENAAAMTNQIIHHPGAAAVTQPFPETIIDVNVTAEAKVAYAYTLQVQHSGTAVFTVNPGALATDARLIAVTFPRSIA